MILTSGQGGQRSSAFILTETEQRNQKECEITALFKSHRPHYHFSALSIHFISSRNGMCKCIRAATLCPRISFSPE